MANEKRLDEIHIKDLLCRCIVGIFPEEREKRQDVLINIVLRADLRTAGISDRIEDAVDYKTVNKKVLRLVEGSSYYLVERLAQRVAEVCLEDRRVRQVVVRVEKPGALRFARSVGVQIVRDQVDAG